MLKQKNHSSNTDTVKTDRRKIFRSRKKRESNEDPKSKLVRALSSILPSRHSVDQDEGYCGSSDDVQRHHDLRVKDKEHLNTISKKNIDIRVKKLKVECQRQEAEVQTLDIISLADDFESQLTVSQPVKRYKVDVACQQDGDGSSLEVTKLKHKIENVEKEKQNLEKQVKTYKNEKFSLQAQAESLQYETLRQQEDNNILKSELDKKDLEIATLKTSTTIQNEAISVLKESKLTSNADISVLANLKECKCENLQLRAQNKELEMKVDTLSKQQWSLQNLVSEDAAICGDVVRMNRRLAEDNTLLTANYHAVKNELRAVSRQCHGLQDQLERAYKPEVRRNKDHRGSEAERNVHEINKQLLEDLATASRDLAAKSRDLESTSRDCHQLKGENEELKADLGQLRISHKRTVAERDQLYDEACLLSHENSDLFEQLQKLRKDFNKISNENHQQIVELTIAKSENCQLKADNECLRRKAVISNSIRASIPNEDRRARLLRMINATNFEQQERAKGSPSPGMESQTSDYESMSSGSSKACLSLDGSSTDA